MLLSRLFLSILEVKLEQNAPDCTYLHLDFKIFQGGHALEPPYIVVRGTL